MRGWLVLVGLFGLACSEEGGKARDVATAGSGAVAAAGADNSGGSAGAAPIAEGGSGGALPLLGSDEGLTLGDPLDLVVGTGPVPYAIGPNPYGIRGGGFLARSAQGNTITVGSEPGQICISGNLEEVPLNPDGHGNYGQYWGVEFGFNLNQAPADGSALPEPPAAGDAGAADAGAAPPMDVAQPWQPGKVVGFSFVIEGPTINLIRFKSLPAGYDSSLESSVFCKELKTESGTTNNALFSELTTYCWSPSSTLLPTGGGLNNISWQLPADVAPAGARPFDWCLKDLRPIVAP
ncbi:MAG TPA: hypothetical protein VFS67_06070 [Polyangiaceae bacterium]|nr:hypothetical protein [Polyangiaceae bacterium]